MLRTLHITPVLIIMVAGLGLPVPAQASNDALLKLLEILRERGSITAAEHDAIQRLAEVSEPDTSPRAPAPSAPLCADASAEASTPPSGPSASSGPAAPPTPALSAAAAAPAAQAKPDVPAPRPSAPRWFERYALRGYTQFRYTESSVAEGPPLDVPSDRSVNENESFVIRRGRVILSGDPSERMSLYLQTDVNASTGAPDFSVQLRDLYLDYWLNGAKTFRIRAGQSKVPFGWSNLQSSQNRLAIERPDGINSAAEGERDIGAFLLWESPAAKDRFRELVATSLKGSGDYGVVAVGGYAGQGPNRSDQNGEPYALARLSYPFKLDSGQFFELGAQAYYGKFVVPSQVIPVGGRDITPTRAADGTTDERVGVTAVWYPQPLGIEAEWNIGRGPELSSDLTNVDARGLTGGYVQVGYRATPAFATMFPFARWNYYDGGRKFARNAPRMQVNELDLGVELAKWAEFEATVMYTRTFERTRTSVFPYALSKGGNRVGFQVQWNY